MQWVELNSKTGDFLYICIFTKYYQKVLLYNKVLGGAGKSLSEAFLFAEHGENMLCTKIVCMSETISAHNMFSPGLSLEFLCIELVIQ